MEVFLRLFRTSNFNLAWEKSSGRTIRISLLPPHCSIGGSFLFHQPIDRLLRVSPFLENCHMMIRVEDEISSFQVLFGGLDTNLVWNEITSGQSGLAESPYTTGETRTISAVALVGTSLTVRDLVSDPLKSFGDGVSPFDTAVGDS